MSEHLDAKELDRMESDLKRCRDDEDYENIAFHYVHQNDSGTSPVVIAEFPLMLITALRAEREAHQATRAELEAARGDREKLRTAMYSVNSISLHRPSCPHCANNLKTAHRVLGQISWPTLDAARDGKDE